MTARDFAELEARLMRELKESPSVASADDEGLRPCDDTEPRRPRIARLPRQSKSPDDPLLELKRLVEGGREPQSNAGRSPESRMRGKGEFARVAADARAFDDRDPLDWPSRVPEPELAPWLHRPRDRAPFAALPRTEPSRFIRNTRVVATVFSLIALAAVSTLLVVRVVGGEPTTKSAEEASSVEQPTAAAQRALVPPASPERDDAPLMTGAIGEKDPSRVPAEHFARGTGTVRPVDTRTAGSGLEPATLGTSARPAGELNYSSVHTRSGNARPLDTQAALGSGGQPPAAGAAPSAAEPAAQTETTVVETGEKAAESLAAAPAHAIRSAAVTEHVNMRAGPKNDAAVLAVVPARDEVEVVNCTQWCEVVYDGRQGFIHRRFVSGTAR